MSGHDHPKAIGGKLFSPLMNVCLGLFALSVAVMAYRFFAGVGPVSAMSDGYAWGIWEPVNVVVFTGIGAGAYSTGLLCYLLNQGKYHPLVRPAVLLGAIAYSLAGASILIALGRYWNVYWLFLPGVWNLGSVLLEVAACVMTYVMVLWIEVLPAVLEGAADSKHPFWAKIGKKWGPVLAKAMPYFIAAAMILPTMHQSSLGGLMLIAGPKLNPLWHTALLPTLALISCLAMGYGAVVALTNILHMTWNAKADQRLFADLSKVNGGLLFLFVVVRLVDIAAHGKLKYLGVFDFHLFFFLLETALFLVPAFMFFSKKVQQNRGKLLGAALLSILAGALWRIDAYLTAYNGGDGFEYMPSLGEIAVTVGMAAVGVAVFLVVARFFPVVVVDDARDHSHVGAGQVQAAAGR
ncbi:Ni/Fe-hydrogenase cytochrome b subunit [Anaeromyxobacter diazotrophicus]|uniref:Ni/Fe-hydrogenase cytochrome b subunit n=1 Tax=Anaeromyxobacter diazotrophicus TaxID=2590199 RepID=A0A7I9VFY9_9BACT|nr:Ni/Fe-hydrogenase cytochrome b subunit [Anaeromyxobacter diazotrophicus]GEJ55293.1 Ni/Fe-hydrogenase cytochrome b subunit [Anaeromyxobacter diazotrophicus]